MTPDAADTAGEYGLVDYLVIVRRRWLWGTGGLVLMVGLALTWAASRPTRFEASAQVLLADTAAQRALDPRFQPGGLLDGQLSNEVALARGDVVEDLVERELGFLPTVELATDAEADVLIFTASAGTPDDAARFANTWAEQYVAVKRNQAITEINAAAESLRAQLEDLRQQRQTLREPLDKINSEILESTNERETANLQRRYDLLEGDLSYELDMVTAQADATTVSLSNLQLQAKLATVGEARIIQVAAPPPAAANTPLSLTLALGTVLGLIAGFALAILAESRDNTIKSVADVASATDIPVLAGIPEATSSERPQLGIATYHGTDGRFAEAYHKVRSALEFASIDREIKTILITSANLAEGKSTTSSNLALAFASVGKRTVLVDADFRRPRQHLIYGMDQAPGLSNVVLHNFDLAAVACPVADAGLETLRVIPTGVIPPAPAAFVGTDGFRDTIQWIRENADIVIIDGPPLLAVSDPHTLARDVDGVVITVRAGSTSSPHLVESVGALKQVGATVLGVVLVGVDRDEGYTDYQPAGTVPLGRGGTDRTDRLWREPTGPVIELRFDRPQRQESPVGIKVE